MQCLFQTFHSGAQNRSISQTPPNLLFNPVPTHHEFLHRDGESGRIKQDLPVLGREAYDFLDEHHKVLGQEFICLKEPEHTSVIRNLLQRRFCNAHKESV